MLTDPSSEASRLSLINDLNSLASEKSSERRVELLRRVTDLFIDGFSNHNEAERYLFEEIVGTIMEKITRGDKIHASTKLATLPEIPRALAAQFAGDADVDVARPILHAPGLHDDILVDIARTGSQDHLHAIATRATVSSPVSDVVVSRGNSTVVHALAANRGAAFSESGMQRLVAKAGGDVDLQALIVQRTDLSPTAIEKLLPLISRELADRLRDLGLQPGTDLIRQHLGEWLDVRKTNVSQVEHYMESIKKGDLRIDDVVIEIAAAGRLFDAATVIASAVDLERDYAFRVLTHGKTQSVLLLLRSIKLKWPAAAKFLALRRQKFLLPMEALSRREDYDAIDPAAAQRAIRFLKVRRAAAAA